MLFVLDPSNLGAGGSNHSTCRTLHRRHLNRHSIHECFCFSGRGCILAHPAAGAQPAWVSTQSARASTGQHGPARASIQWAWVQPRGFKPISIGPRGRGRGRGRGGGCTPSAPSLPTSAPSLPPSAPSLPPSATFPITTGNFGPQVCFFHTHIVKY